MNIISIMGDKLQSIGKYTKTISLSASYIVIYQKK